MDTRAFADAPSARDFAATAAKTQPRPQSRPEAEPVYPSTPASESPKPWSAAHIVSAVLLVLATLLPPNISLSTAVFLGMKAAWAIFLLALFPLGRCGTVYLAALTGTIWLWTYSWTWSQLSVSTSEAASFEVGVGFAAGVIAFFACLVLRNVNPEDMGILGRLVFSILSWFPSYAFTPNIGFHRVEKQQHLYALP
ncbi:hypothetical protein C8R45DRAFT_60563 [Mycena sanguinolenta]|nr:hypothetical protein C8R45DRAFT_60563 [Mycena sanguinolenta]